MPPHPTDQIAARQILDGSKITSTIEKLQVRIGERFPESGLHSVCGKLAEISQQTASRTEYIDQPIWWIRILTAVLIVSIIACGIVIPFSLDDGQEKLTKFRFLELFEAAVNDIVLIGALVFFLFTLERRFKRKKALDAIHELRSIAHIIDMHQLTKDPDRATSNVYVPTDESPKNDMTVAELRRYLDYCSEMLSLTGKVAALYVQRFEDQVALAAVNEIENLTTSLSRKIWQKITILKNAET